MPVMRGVSEFRPTCPRCGELCEPGATVCTCGARTGLRPPEGSRVPPVVKKWNEGAWFVVTEIEGWLTHEGAAKISGRIPSGLSAHVIDTAVNHRVMATFRTEDLPHSNYNGGLTPWERRERVRGLARARALELNAGVS